MITDKICRYLYIQDFYHQHPRKLPLTTENNFFKKKLFMDNNDITITYELFAGNTNDCLTYHPNLLDKKEFELGRLIIVVDKGITTGDNIWYTINTPTRDGYIKSLLREESALLHSPLTAYLKQN